MADGRRFDFDLDSFDAGESDSPNREAREPLLSVTVPETANSDVSSPAGEMLVVFVVDISGSMKGARIDSVNQAIRNVLSELKRREDGGRQAAIKIAILEFSTRANWRTLFPEPVATFGYRDIEKVYGGTNYSTAFATLNEKLSRRQFLSSSAEEYSPLIVFMTDGKPSDMGLYKEELDSLKTNRWFRNSTRFGIAIEEGAMSPECKQVLTEFTENEKNVYEAADTAVLAGQIELVTLRGVDLVKRQGSVQFTEHSAAERTASVRREPAGNHPAPPAQAFPGVPDSAEPPMQTDSDGAPLSSGEIDWEHDFDF